MSDKPNGSQPGDPGDSAGSSGAAPAGAGRPRRRRRGRRIALLSAGSVVVLVGALVVAGFAVVNNLASGIPRVHVAQLDAAGQPGAAAKPAGGPRTASTGENLLLTGHTPGQPHALSGLIMILHINADHQAGGVVSLPPNAVVSVPGHGRQQLWYALQEGGPSLLVETVKHLTNLPIQHYAGIDFGHVSNVVDAVGGVNVEVPKANSAFGHYFHKGVNHLDGATALLYARDNTPPPNGELGRVWRQQSLIRAVLYKIANQNLLLNPATMYHVLSAITSMLTVDSNFTNGEIESLAKEMAGLGTSAGTFVTAPTYEPMTMHGDGPVHLKVGESHQLWLAIRQDAISSFAKKYPSTVTPSAVP